MTETEQAAQADFMKRFGELKWWPAVGDLPIKVSKIETQASRAIGAHRVGQWVSVRVCTGTDEQKKRTYLGVYLGNLLSGEMIVTYHPPTESVEVLSTRNPAMWVPELQRVVWGCESFWGVIKSPDALRAITDLDIQDVWYVRALKELSGEPPKRESVES